MTSIKCPVCGKGKVDLELVHPELSKTLWDVQCKPGWTATQLSGLYVNVKPMAMNQRLERLRAMGLVRRERNGKSFHYFAVKK